MEPVAMPADLQPSLVHRRALRLLVSRFARKAWPVFTSSTTAGLLYAAGDCAAQNIEEQYDIQSTGKTQYNTDRTMRVGMFGFFVAGPVLGMWYSRLHQMTSVYRWSFLPVQSAGVGSTNSWMNSLRTSYRRERMVDNKDLAQEVLVKVVFDQLFFQAFFLNLYLFSTSIFEGKTLKETLFRCKRDFHSAWGYSIAFWLPAQTLNFAFMPARLHSTTVIVLNSVWQTILSLLYHQRDYGSNPSAESEEDAQPSAVSAVPLDKESVPEADDVTRLAGEIARLRSQSAEQLSEILEQRQQIEHLLEVVEVQARSLRAICESSRSRSGGESAAVLSALCEGTFELPSAPTSLEDAHGARWLAAAASLSAAGGLLLLGALRRGER